MRRLTHTQALTVLTTPPAGAQLSDSAAAVATVRAFHDALAAGDSLGALALLADDATILEAGGAEFRTEYRSGHLAADIRHARAVKTTRTVSRVGIVDRVAWVAGVSETSGTVQDRQINSVGAELVVLVRESAGWRIRAIHWSSRNRAPK